MEETVSAYEDLVRQGKLLYWGVSQWQAHHIEEACRIADARRAYRPVSNQPQYSILRRQIEAEVLPTCEREGLGQIVYSPMGQGVLTGKYSGGVLPPGTRATDEQRNQFMQSYLASDVLARVDKLEPLARDLGLSMAQFALAWCLRHRSVSSVIVGATNPAQLEDNVGAAGAILAPEITAEIDAIFPAPTP